MVLAILYLQIGQLDFRRFPDTPDNHWAHELLKGAFWFADNEKYFAQFPPGRRRLLRTEFAMDWLVAFQGVSKKHRYYYFQRDEKGHSLLSKAKANELQTYIDYLYEGLFRLQKDFEPDIARITTAKNKQAIEEAKLELRIIHLEKELPAKMKLPRKRNMDLREVAYEDGK